jgi:AmmeMemoRadiSam system protein B
MVAFPYPRLRQLDFQPIHYQGQRMWLLRDPWQLSDRQIIFPPALAMILPLCDGAHSLEEIHAALSAQLEEIVPVQVVSDALDQLDLAYLLENERSAAERARRQNAYRALPARPAALAGVSYPEPAGDLAHYLDQFEHANGHHRRPAWRGRGLISPHIDYQRGGRVYAQVWREAEHAVADAELVLIFGTDHNGRPGSITLTPQPYATPFGVLPTDVRLVDELAEAIGVADAYAEELNHVNEHSVELSAVWLHHVFRRVGEPPCPMIPILVGSFHHYLEGGHPAEEPSFNRFLEALARTTAGRRVLAVGSVDLAHVGPAFGDHFLMNDDRRANLRAEDEALIQKILNGDAAGFFEQIQSVRDRNRICGFAPIYLLLRYLQTTGGALVAYDHCPADANDTSLVSICGLLLD